MSKYFFAFNSYKLALFLMPIDNHSKKYLKVKCFSLYLSIIHVCLCVTSVLLNKILTIIKGDFMGLTKKIKNKTKDSLKIEVSKRGNSNALVLNNEIALFLGLKINANDLVEIKKTKEPTTFKLKFLDKENLINE